MLMVWSSTKGIDADGFSLGELIASATPTAASTATLGVFWAVIIVLYFVPGPTQQGPITPTGHVPTYVDNGIVHMVTFTTLFVGGAAVGLYPLSIFYDQMMPMVGTLNLAALIFCVYLYIKGCTHPSTKDVTFSGKGFIFDYYCGIELYPRIWGVDVKKIVNCRFSMTFWMNCGLSCVAASYDMHSEYDWGLCWCAALTFTYLFKFFLWEIGYMRSIDIIEDNAGWYETWGCLVWVPCLYTNHMHCAVRTPSGMSPAASTAIGIFGLTCILLNYWSDRQRQVFRETNGESMLWWPVPPESLEVTYTVNINGKAQKKTNLFLVNGFWGVVRHPQYIFELGSALSWGLLTNPTLRYGQSLFYFVFLTVLLFHRALRDAAKCREKYGKDYVKYADRVKYMVIPYVF
jgi:7-dehydrocholesterol reductase